jgi:hypothetical protein
VAAHPLSLDLIHDVAVAAWNNVWNTTIGSGATAIRLADLNAPATVIGYFFEVLFARELETRYPEDWRGNRTGEEKDLVCIKAPEHSVEIKSSGQLGFKVYGNRSYSQEVENTELAKKEKSGYYITANFYQQTLTLLRFGWLDIDDWKGQKAATGQMAGLSKIAYEDKLVIIPGDYRLDGPVELLKGVGEKMVGILHGLGIHTIRDYLDYSGKFPKKRPRTIREAALKVYRPAPESGSK